MNDVIKGIVIATRDYREYDTMLDVLCEDYDTILHVIARGIRKVKSKNAGACQLFTYASVQLDYHEQRDMQMLKTAEILNSYRHIREDLVKQSIASFFCECMAKSGFAQEGFALLRQSLDVLVTTHHPMRILCVFQVMMNRLQGIEPFVDGCVSCGKDNQICGLSVSKGGFICQNCYQALQDTTYSAQDLKYFRLLSKGGMEHYDILKTMDAFTFTHFEMLFAYFEEYAGISLKSIRFLRCLKELND